MASWPTLPEGGAADLSLATLLAMVDKLTADGKAGAARPAPPAQVALPAPSAFTSFAPAPQPANPSSGATQGGLEALVQALAFWGEVRLSTAPVDPSAPGDSLVGLAHARTVETARPHEAGRQAAHPSSPHPTARAALRPQTQPDP